MAVTLSGKLQFNQHFVLSIRFFLPNLAINQFPKILHFSVLDALPGRSVRSWSNPNTDHQGKNTDQSPTRTDQVQRKKGIVPWIVLVENLNSHGKQTPLKTVSKEHGKTLNLPAPTQHITSMSKGNIQGKHKAIKHLQVCNSLSTQNSLRKIKARNGGVLDCQNPCVHQPGGKKKEIYLQSNTHEGIVKQFKKLKMFKKFFFIFFDLILLKVIQLSSVQL